MDGYIKGQPNVEWWMTQVHKGIKYRKKKTYQDRWDDWRNYYRGDFRGGVLPVNVFFKMARTVVPRIYFRNPSISITPAKPGMLNWAFAQMLERIDNKLIRMLKLKRTMKTIVNNSWFFGSGFAKLGFGSEFNLSLAEFGGEPPIIRGGRRVEFDTRVIENMPWVDSTHPGNFVVPDGLTSYEKTPWVAEWIQRSMDDVKADPRFKNRNNLVSGYKSRANDYSHEYPQSESREIVDMVEIHDLRKGKVIVIAPYANDESRILFFGDDDLNFFGASNYKPLIFNEVDNCFWGLPDTKILEPEQLEINEIRTLMMYHWRLGVAKFAYDKTKLDDQEQLMKIVDGEVLGGIAVKGTPANAIEMFRAADIPQSLLQADSIINQDIREDMGFSRNEFGDYTAPSSRTTATESRIVKMASEIRVDERRDMAADLLLDIVEHMNYIIFNQWTHEQVIDIVGPLGIPIWVKFQPQQLARGSYNIKIDPDTSLPETKDLREQRAIQLYTLLKDNPLIDPMRLTRYLLHELHGVQFDDMMRGMPPGLGGPADPIDIQQYVAFATRIAQLGIAQSPPGQQILLPGENAA